MRVSLMWDLDILSQSDTDAVGIRSRFLLSFAQS